MILEGEQILSTGGREFFLLKVFIFVFPFQGGR